MGLQHIRLRQLAGKGLALALFASLFSAAGVSRAESLYVANISSNSVEQYTSGGTKSVFASAGLDQPVGLAFNSAGHLFVSNSNLNYIEELDGAGVPVRSISLPAASGPTGMVFDSLGNLYVAESNANRIDKITFGGPTPSVSTYIDQNADGYLSSPVGLAFDGDGFLYIADSAANQVERINHSLAPSLFAIDTTPNDPLNVPFGLAFDPTGNLFVTSAGNNSIEKIKPTGEMSVFANGSVGLDVPTGIAFDGAGNMFVANAGQNFLNTIQEFAAGSSTPSLFATVSDSDHRRLIAFGPDTAAVPLPSAAVAAIPLLALLGLSQLRRRIA